MLAQLTSNPTPIALHAHAPLAWRKDHAVYLQLNRPAEHNRFDPDDLQPLTQLLTEIKADFDSGFRSIRSVVISGSGEKTFSSGYTLSALQNELDVRFDTMLNTLEDLPQFTIAALNGSVYGGATDLALCCDARIGLTGTKMFMPAAKIGLHYYAAGLRRYVSKLGHTATSKIMLTALTIDCYEMQRIGYLTELCERDQQASVVATYVDAIAANDPLVIAQMKSHLRKIAEGRPDWEALQQDHLASLRSDSLTKRLSNVLKK